ncbi:T-cell surface glycoprotein CD3 epsilon chain isoform X2 [Mixophyes fleayi]|uniref:T-cell surface glycoprotein CD3 epsilon chain isoform X2 n=1 Tax=Mixophyes fleayi TaxID=3061075 RepID=UPI003F4DFE7F
MKPQILLSFLVAGLFVDLLSAEDESAGDNFKVHISGLSVSIICPKEGTLKMGKQVISENRKEHVVSDFSSSKNGLYECENEYLYLHAYVCETCTDVSITTVALVLIADCLVTLGVSFIVYFGCRRKSGGGVANEGHKKDNKERPPPVPNPDYEPIRKGKQEIYNGLNRNFK